MPETPEEFYRRGLGASADDGRLPVPEMVAWDVWPFEPEGVRVKLLEAPVVPEPPREGEGGRPCLACGGRDDTRVVWSNERWTVRYLAPSGATLVVVLEPREHLDFVDLSDELASELGRLGVGLARAIEGLPHVIRAHMYRIGDGGSHLHVFFFARPEGLTPLRGSAYIVWDDILPARPEADVRADALDVATELVRTLGGTAHS